MVAIVTALREPYGPSPYPPPVRSIDTTQSELFQNQPVTILVPLDNAAVNPLEVIVLQPDGTVYVTTSVYPATVFGSRVAVYSFTPAEFGWWQIQTYPGGAEQNNYFFYVYAPPLKIPRAIGLMLPYPTTGVTQRSITSGANLPITTSDRILNVNVASPLTITLPLASSMGGISLAFKILIGSQSATFVPTGSDTFDTLTTLVGAAGQSVTFIPFNDGVNSGYAIW